MPLEGESCDCTYLRYFCESLRCRGTDRACDVNPADFRVITDEHGCRGYEVVPTGAICPE